ncbi:MAG: sugar transferase, partial [Candidatus Rokuibacteriota bacterium]
MFEERSEQLHRVTALLDIALTVFVFLAASWLRTALLDNHPVDFLSHLALLPFVLALWMFFLTFFGAYRSPRVTSLLQYAWSATRGVAVGLAFLLTILFLFKVQYVSRTVMVTFAAVDLLALVGIRLGTVWYFHRSLRRGEYFRK